MRERVPLLIGLALLAVAVVIAGAAVGRGIRDRNSNDVLTVTGSAKAMIASDYAIWDFSVTSQDASASKAATALNVWTKQVDAFLKGAGVKPSELTIQPVSTTTVNPSGAGYSNKVVGYQLTQNFEVRSTRVAAVADVANKSSQLLVAGIPLSAQPLEYIYTKLNAIRGPLLAAAVKDAQQRAKVLLSATGGKLGKLRGVDVSPFQVTSPNSTDVSDEGLYDTSTLRKEVTAVVNVTFGLN